ncbi:hypothetical protein ACIBW9_24190 [Streptomyces sp. NPDC049541]|uniref:hypothetical protein n=1 Tax=Streptomyces sp. NPDC049541 TaxID=3365594 RepID=UPI0037888FFA
MGGGSNDIKGLWVAIVLLGAAVVGSSTAAVFWVAQGGRPTGDRVMHTLAAGGAAFAGVAVLGITIGEFISG